MPRLLVWSTALALTALLVGSTPPHFLDPVSPRAIAITAEPYLLEGATLSKRFQFLRGWTLESRDGEFGGLSALAATPEGLIATSDRGAIFMLKQDAAGKPLSAAVHPLPLGCGDGRTKLQRDAEALARDPGSGDFWIGLEWQNALCRSEANLKRGILARPRQMADWPRLSGPESVVRLADGRTIVIAERPPAGAGDSVMLVYKGDPLSPGLRATQRIYRNPPGYRPTDAAELPDGGLIIVHRQFRLLLDFRTIVSIVPAAALDGDAPINARPVALFRPPGLSDNFEGIAVTQARGRTFVWLTSDDNFVLSQKTYLLKFELSGSGSGVR